MGTLKPTNVDTQISHKGVETVWIEGASKEGLWFNQAQECVYPIGPFVKAKSTTPPNKRSKYHKTTPSGKDVLDVYDVLHMWVVPNPGVQHAIKKLLQPGARGHKTYLQDLKEAKLSIERAIELQEQCQPLE